MQNLIERGLVDSVVRGEPVYVVKGKCQWWDIVDFTAGGWLYLRIANKTDLALDDYGTKWLAYRRKPEG